MLLQVVAFVICFTPTSATCSVRYALNCTCLHSVISTMKSALLNNYQSHKSTREREREKRTTREKEVPKNQSSCDKKRGSSHQCWSYSTPPTSISLTKRACHMTLGQYHTFSAMIRRRLPWTKEAQLVVVLILDQMGVGQQ